MMTATHCHSMRPAIGPSQLPSRQDAHHPTWRASRKSELEQRCQLVGWDALAPLLSRAGYGALEAVS
jgi:hypothetical protein